MFAPLGYVPFEDVSAICDDAADEYFSGIFAGDYSQAEASEEAHFGTALLSTWLIAWTLHQSHVVICSPDGRVYRAAMLLLFHEDMPHVQRWHWPLPPGSRLHRLLQRSISERDFGAGVERFRFLDTVTWTVWADHERLSRLRNDAVELDEDVERQCRVAVHFDGWSICIPEAQAYKATADLWRALQAHPADDDMLPGPRAITGRPKLQGLARASYWRLFPGGHRGLPWKEVERRIEEEAGRRISAKTIQRAISQSPDITD